MVNSSKLINKEIQLYLDVSKKIKLRKIWDLLEMTPHEGQQPLIEAFDEDLTKNSFVLTLGRRSGKSVQAGVIAIRELLIPYSNTILLAPSYRNSKVIFDEVYRLVLKLKLPIKSINKNQFTIELENSAKFSALTESNVEAGLGSRCSLLLVDETQSINSIMHILESLIFPMLLDFSVNALGILNANVIFLGTPRGVGSDFHELFLYELTRDNWQSFSSPSHCNPLLPTKYLDDQELILSERAYKQEILAMWLTAGAGVFFAFDLDNNVYNPDELDLKGSKFITGHDFGALDSTAMVYIYTNNKGEFYAHDTYMANMRTTAQHYKAFYTLAGQDKTAEQEGSYGDPSAAQSMMDLRNTYNYDIQKGYNKIAAGVAIINELLEPQGLDRKPKLFVSSKCKELITQLQLITYRNGAGKQSSTGDPFNKHKLHHFDLVHALRYAIVSHYRQNQAAITVLV